MYKNKGSALLQARLKLVYYERLYLRQAWVGVARRAPWVFPLSLTFLSALSNLVVKVRRRGLRCTGLFQQIGMINHSALMLQYPPLTPTFNRVGQSRLISLITSITWNQECSRLLAGSERVTVRWAQSGHHCVDGSPPVLSSVLISLLQLQHET